MTNIILALFVGFTIVLLIHAIITQFRLNKFQRIASKFEKEIKKQTPMFYNEDNKDLDDNYLIDIRPDRFNYGGAIAIQGETVSLESNGESLIPKKTVRTAIKPKDVLNELTKPPTKWSLEGIDDKIEILKQKEKIIQQRYAKQDVKALIQFLENRKKYDEIAKDGKTFRVYFSQFDITDENKINDLTKKYTLRMDNADIFIPEFPTEAVKIMTEYTDKVEEFCGKKPRYYVIAQEKDFQKQQDRRDPILLSQSPFGFYYYILGAWDREMLLLPEL